MTVRLLGVVWWRAAWGLDLMRYRRVMVRIVGVYHPFLSAAAASVLSLHSPSNDPRLGST